MVVERLAPVDRSYGVNCVSAPITLMRAGSRASSSAAICVNTVREPCPISDVLTRTRAVPSACNRTAAVDTGFAPAAKSPTLNPRPTIAGFGSPQPTVTDSWIRRHLGPHARFRITPVLDLAGQAPVDAYEIPHRHRQAVHLMTPADTFPFSTNLTHNMEVDHTEPFDHHAATDGSGQSRVGNYGPMTRFHHRIKTHGGWQVKQPYPGIYIWRDPHGAFYLVDHTGTRRTNSQFTLAA